MYYQPMDDISAFILAGGRSIRMGCDKALLEVEGMTLLDRALLRAREVTSQVWIVGQAAKFSSYEPVIEDVYRDCGPLGGIHAALGKSTNELNLMLAVDLPFLEAKFLHYLVAEARGNQAVVTVPESGEGLQPLCAVYRPAFAGVAEQALLKRQNKIDSLFAQVETRVIRQAELARQGFAGNMFHNLNTPGDLESLRALRL